MKDQGWQGIAPSTGWLAVFVHDKGTFRTERVALWAWERQVDVDGTVYDRATGVLGRESMEQIDYAEDADWFVGYCHESEDIGVYAGEAQRIIERNRKKRAEQGR